MISQQAWDKTAVIDSDLCINCGACVEACPGGAIVEEDEGPVVIETICRETTCNFECVDVCPVEAIRVIVY